MINLLSLGANFPPYSLEEEPFRLVTSMFLHGHLLHLLANMYSLFFLGTQLEQRIGSVSYLIVYFITGLFAGVASINFNLFLVSVGASGAIFGVYGFLLVQSIRENPRIRFSIIANFVIYILVVSAIGSQLHFDNAGHFGGVIAGLLMGLAYGKIPDMLLFAGSTTLMLASFLLSPRDQVDYFNSYQKFIAADSRISKIMNAPLSDADFYDSLNRVKNLPQETIDDFRNLAHVSHKLKRDTTLIVDYLTLKSSQIDYFLLGLSRESFIYLDSIRVQFRLGSFLCKFFQSHQNRMRWCFSTAVQT